VIGLILRMREYNRFRTIFCNNYYNKTQIIALKKIINVENIMYNFLFYNTFHNVFLPSFSFSFSLF